jgi:hypothetical protein
MQTARNVVLAALVTAVATVPAAAQTVDEVLEKHYAAIGGVEGWSGLRTMKGSGTLDVMGGMMSGPFTIVQKRPSMFRMEIEIQGMQVIQAYDGSTAWQVMPMIGIDEPEAADAALAAQLEEQADLDGPFVGWEEAGLAIELDGTETIDGVEATRLLVTSDDGKVWRYYLDPDYMLIRMVTTETVQGVEGEYTTRLGDYRAVGGLMFAHSIEVDTPMGSQKLTFDSIEANVPVDDAVFSMAGG